MYFQSIQTRQSMELHSETVVLVLILVAVYLLFCMTRKGSHLIVDWPVIGMLPTLIANYNHLLDHITALLTEFNHTMMFNGPWFSGINFLFTCDPDNANYMFNLRFANYPKGDAFPQILDVLGEGIITAEGDSWLTKRKKALVFISQRRFRASVGKQTEKKVTSVLLPMLRDLAEREEVVDLNDVLMRFAFDVTCHLFLGVDPGCLAPEFPSIAYAKAVEYSEEIILYRHVVPMAWWKLMRALRLGKEKKMIRARKVIDTYMEKCIRERRKELMNNSTESRDDMLSSYMKDGLEDKFLRDTAFSFLAAGKDLTGAALVWLFWLIAINPNVESKILKELRVVVAAKCQNSENNNEMMTFDAEETDPLVYLDAVVSETLRLYPSVPFNPKEVAQDDILPSGHKVPAGTKIMFCLYAMGRMDRIWGEDCLEFRPERWITETGSLRREPAYKFIAFHSGPRSCLGRRIAYTQIKMLAATVLYNFEVKIVEGHVPEPKILMVIQVKNGLLVTLKKRNIKG